MNYFSHFITDHETGNDYYNTGLLLPDVTRQWVKQLKNPIIPFPGTKEEAIFRGCARHYASDKKFHASSFFREIQELSDSLIKQTPFSALLNRKWFLAHIMSELMIDRIMVKAYPELLNAFYDSLDRAEADTLRSFFRCYGWEETGDFFHFFNHFRSVRYIQYYTDNNKFVYSLNRIMLRAGVGEMHESDQQLLLTVVLKLEQAMGNDYSLLLQKLKHSTQ